MGRSQVADGHIVPLAQEKGGDVEELPTLHMPVGRWHGLIQTMRNFGREKWEERELQEIF
jgi:hypothetical protein